MLTHLRVGDIAPDFEALDQDEKTVRLADFRGEKVILYFYPKDNTPTCTVEACNLRDNEALLQSKGFRILGVSPDTAKQHQGFIKKHNLPFPLLVDTELTICKAYGVWGEKKFMGKVYDGLHRTTFIIDAEGKIERIIDKVKSKEHAQQILE